MNYHANNQDKLDQAFTDALALVVQQPTNEVARRMLARAVMAYYTQGWSDGYNQRQSEIDSSRRELLHEWDKITPVMQT